MNKSFLATIATISLTFAGLVTGVAPASAVDYNTESALQSQNILRPGTPTVTANNVVVSVSLNANEAFNYNGFRSLTQYAPAGSPLTIAPGDAVAFTGGVLNTATQASAVSTSNSGSTQVFWKKTGDFQFTRWDSFNQTLSQLPTGTFVDFQVFRQMSLSASTPGTYRATHGLTVAGVAVTPVPLAKIDINQALNVYQVYDIGFSVRWTGGLNYIPSALDEYYSVQSNACIWPADLNLTNSSVIEVTYNNFDIATNSFASANSVNVSAYPSGGGGSFNASGTESNGNEVFSVALTNVSWEAMQVYANAYVYSPTANLVKPVFQAWLAGDSSKTNILEPCQKFESFAAPTLTSIDSASATLSWAAPSNASSRNWNNIAVYACSTAVTSACGDMSTFYSMNAPARPYDFRFSGIVSGTSVTLSSTSMRTAMVGPPNGVDSPTWSPTAAYRYFVFYSNNSFTGYKSVSALTAALTAGGVESTPSTPSTPDASATVVRSEPVLKGFAGHSVAKGDQRKFELDASGLTGTPEVLLNGKKLTYTKDANGKLSIDLPKGLKRGGSYDLVVSSPEGTVTVLGAIVLAADLPFVKKTPRAFAGTSTTLSASQVRDIRALVSASEFGDTVTCTAYVSGATTDEVAVARATNACAAATAVNPDLKTVIRTAPAIASVRNKVRVVIG
jgi:hypothetical protein